MGDLLGRPRVAPLFFYFLSDFPMLDFSIIFHILFTYLVYRIRFDLKALLQQERSGGGAKSGGNSKTGFALVEGRSGCCSASGMVFAVNIVKSSRVPA